MKTTVDLPDELYRQTKALAALRRQKMKDLVAKGLRMVLDEDERSRARPSALEMMRTIRENPLHSTEEIEKCMKGANDARKSGWNRDDAE